MNKVLISVVAVPKEVKWLVVVNGKQVGYSRVKLLAEQNAITISRALDALGIENELDGVTDV